MEDTTMASVNATKVTATPASLKAAQPQGGTTTPKLD